MDDNHCSSLRCSGFSRLLPSPVIPAATYRTAVRAIHRHAIPPMEHGYGAGVGPCVLLTGVLLNGGAGARGLLFPLPGSAAHACLQRAVYGCFFADACPVLFANGAVCCSDGMVAVAFTARRLHCAATRAPGAGGQET